MSEINFYCNHVSPALVALAKNVNPNVCIGSQLLMKITYIAISAINR
jgi:hypothetical protein